MIQVIKKDGETVAVPSATAAEVRGREVVCYDRRGVIIARFPSESVTLFGPHLPSPEQLAREEEDGSAAD
jgi:hypothetical protein